MALSKTRFCALAVMLVLAGCSVATTPPSGSETAIRVVPDNSPPVLGETRFFPKEVTPGQPTGTFVGQKVYSLRSELQQLQNTLQQRNETLQATRERTVQDSKGYHETVAEINARLQIGSTPGNPILQRQWELAQQQLDAINQDISLMNQLATQVASDSAMIAYLLDSVRAAFGLSGAVDEDHRQLRILEDETNQAMVLIQRLLSELSQDISRQQSYVANERSNLNSLAASIKSGQFYGVGQGNPQQALFPVGGAGADGRRPLVVIRFDRPNVFYEQALFSAVSRALERRPNASFDVVAVTPTGSSAANDAAAQRNAEQVFRSLGSMGLTGDRLRLSSMSGGTSTTNAVHLYVR